MTLLREAVRTGTVLDLSSESPLRNPPASCECHPQELPAAIIRRILLEPDLQTDPHGLRIEGAQVTGTLNLDHTHVKCRIEFRHCCFKNIPSFENATIPELDLENSKAPGLRISRATITGGASLRGFETDGNVDLSNMRIGGQLVLSQAVLKNPKEEALSMQGAVVAGDAIFRGLETEGQVRLTRANITGQLNFQDAVLKNPGGNALSMDRVTVVGSALLRCLKTEGEVRLLGASINGQLDFQEAVLKNPGGNALSMDGVSVARGAFLGGIKTDGEVRLLAANITVQLDFGKAVLKNPTGEALSMDGITVAGDVFLRGLKTEGEVRLHCANITGQLNLTNANLRKPTGTVLYMNGVTVTNTVFLDGLRTEGGLNLSSSSIGILSVGSELPTAQGLPILSAAQGWKLGGIKGFLRANVKETAKWLDTIDVTHPSSQKEFVSQPWMEMAKLYDQIGQPEDGRYLRLQAARRTTRVVPLLSKLPRWLYAILVGYGYYPLIVLAWLAILWFGAFTLSLTQANAFTPTDRAATTLEQNNGKEPLKVTGATAPPESYLKFSPALFATDIAIPAAATGQEAAWHITGNTWLPAIFACFKGAGWIFTALLLAGITGILRKE